MPSLQLALPFWRKLQIQMRAGKTGLRAKVRGKGKAGVRAKVRAEARGKVRAEARGKVKAEVKDKARVVGTQSSSFGYHLNTFPSAIPGR